MSRQLIVASALIGVLTILGVGCASHEKAEENEVKMKLDQVPPAVKETFEKESGGATIATVDQEKSKDGKIVYETDVMKDGKNWEIKVGEDGKLISKTMEEGKEKDEKSEEKGK